MRTVYVFQDFEREGKDASEFNLVYDNSSSPGLMGTTQNALEKYWLDQSQDDLEPNLINFVKIDTLDDGKVVITTKNGSWAAYRTNLEAKEGKFNPEDFGFSDLMLYNLEKNSNPLSSMPRVTVNDYILFGQKGEVTPEGKGRVSYPGAGFLKKKDDTEMVGEQVRHMKQIEDIVAREIEEETGCVKDDLLSINVLSVAKDDKTHYNSAFFSNTVLKERTINDVIEGWRGAKHRKEHEFVMGVPKEHLIEFVRADIQVAAEALTDATFKEIIWSDDVDMRTYESTTKAQYASLLAVRELFGEEEYRRILEEARNNFQIKQLPRTIW